MHRRKSNDYTVCVSASSLFEAVALGITALQGNDWVAGIAEGPHAVTVAVTDIPVEHRVDMKDFRSWLERPARSPKDVADDNRTIVPS